MPKGGKLFIVSGPSGVGKSTVVQAALGRLAGRLEVFLSVSVTTRRPRRGEVDGVDYRFIEEAEFNRLRDGGGLVEWARVHNHWYGTPAAPLREALAAGKCALLEIDVQGGIQAHQQFPEAVALFLEPPSDAELRRRIVDRATEDDESIRRRLEAAHDEWRTARECGAYSRFIVNDQLDECIRQVEKFLLEEARR